MALLELPRITAYKVTRQNSFSTYPCLLFRELQKHPFTGKGKPEALKYQFSGAWSRRINHKDRLVYQVDGDVVTVFVLAMR